MNFFLSLIMSLFMAVSATPSNPVIAELLTKVNADPAAPAVTYESTPTGDALLIIQEVPVTTAVLQQMPLEQIKPALAAEMKNANGDERALLDELKKDKISIIIRLTANDGGTADVVLTPADF